MSVWEHLPDWLYVCMLQSHLFIPMGKPLNDVPSMTLVILDEKGRAHVLSPSSSADEMMNLLRPMEGKKRGVGSALKAPSAADTYPGTIIVTNTDRHEGLKTLLGNSHQKYCNTPVPSMYVYI